MRTALLLTLLYYREWVAATFFSLFQKSVEDSKSVEENMIQSTDCLEKKQIFWIIFVAFFMFDQLMHKEIHVQDI